MPPVFDFLFGQYSGYASIDIVLEITGVLFGLLSVWYAKKNNIWVYPTGMISTSIFVYLLFKLNKRSKKRQNKVTLIRQRGDRGVPLPPPMIF